MSLVRSSVQNPSEVHQGVEMDHYQGPHGGGASYQQGYRTSFERAGGAFTTKGLSEGRSLAGLSAQNRSGLVNWDAGSSNTPGFK